MNKIPQNHWPRNYFNTLDTLLFHISWLRMEEQEWREEEKRTTTATTKEQKLKEREMTSLLWPVLCGLAGISCVGEQGVHELHGRGREVEIKSGETLCRHPSIHQPNSGWSHFLFLFCLCLLIWRKSTNIGGVERGRERIASRLHAQRGAHLELNTWVVRSRPDPK